MKREMKLRIHNNTGKAALKFFKRRLDAEEKRGTTFRSSRDEIFETITSNKKSR